MNWFQLLLQLLPALPGMVSGIEKDIEVLSQHPQAKQVVKTAMDAVDQVGSMLQTVHDSLPPTRDTDNG